jgi:hypothetical protein
MLPSSIQLLVAALQPSPRSTPDWTPILSERRWKSPSSSPTLPSSAYTPNTRALGLSGRCSGHVTRPLGPHQEEPHCQEGPRSQATSTRTRNWLRGKQRCSSLHFFEPRCSNRASKQRAKHLPERHRLQGPFYPPWLPQGMPMGQKHPPDKTRTHVLSLATVR